MKEKVQRRESQGKSQKECAVDRIRGSCLSLDACRERLTHTLQQEEDFRATATFNDDPKWTTGTPRLSFLVHTFAYMCTFARVRQCWK